MEEIEKMLPEKGAWEGLYWDQSNDIQGYQIRARDMVDVVTPMFRVTPPAVISYEETDATTTTYMLTKIIDGKTYVQKYIVKVKERGTDNEEIESLTLPDGQVINFTNWTIN